VQNPQQMVHPSAVLSLRRRSPSLHRRAGATTGRAPPLPRLLETGAAGSQIYGPIASSPGEQFQPYRSTVSTQPR
jgi:hypothetical protein